MRPDRIIVGVDDESTIEMFNKLYEPFMHKRARLVSTDIASAELTKYAANSMLASRISFMNSLAILAEKVGADINQVRIGMGYDPRIGPDFLYAGIGYGGSCFPKDVKGLLKIAEAYDVSLPLVEQTNLVNARMSEYFFAKIRHHFDGKLNEKVFSIWGLSFKPKTDDMRDAPSVTLINHLLKAGARVKVYDPVAIQNARKIFADRVEYYDSSFDCVNGSDALVLVTEWQEFKSPDFNAIKSAMKTPVIFDGRNIYCSHDLKKLGFDYYGVGLHS